jgi:hypothetical protein
MRLVDLCNVNTAGFIENCCSKHQDRCVHEERNIECNR